MAEHRLAQINVARLRHPLDSPITAEFLRASPKISRLAANAPGFVWQYRSAVGQPGAAEETGDPLLVLNLSVWRSYADLHAYVYRTTHFQFVRRRLRWFEPVETPATALWWVPAGHEPTPAEGLARLAYLRANGPTPRAFTVQTRFDPTGVRERPRRRPSRRHGDVEDASIAPRAARSSSRRLRSPARGNLPARRRR